MDETILTASWEGNEDVVREYLEDPNIDPIDIFNNAMVAASGGRLGVVRLLLAYPGATACIK